MQPTRRDVLALSAATAAAAMIPRTTLSAQPAPSAYKQLVAKYHANLPPAELNPLHLVQSAAARPGEVGVAPLPTAPLPKRFSARDNARLKRFLRTHARKLEDLEPILDAPEGGRRLTGNARTDVEDAPINAWSGAKYLLQANALHHMMSRRAEPTVLELRRLLALTKAVGHEPIGFTQLVRRSIAVTAAWSTICALNQFVTDAPLHQLQAELLHEATVHDPELPPVWERAYSREVAPDEPESESEEALTRQMESARRAQALLRTTAAMIACERYRQIHDAWPKELAALTPAWLADPPVDPFTQKPILYQHVPDGILVYSVGPNRKDDAGSVWTGLADFDTLDLGARLVHPVLRGTR